MASRRPGDAQVVLSIAKDDSRIAVNMPRARSFADFTLSGNARLFTQNGSEGINEDCKIW